MEIDGFATFCAEDGESEVVLKSGGKHATDCSQLATAAALALSSASA
jgi:hypothetical protein